MNDLKCRLARLSAVLSCFPDLFWIVLSCHHGWRHGLHIASATKQVKSDFKLKKRQGDEDLMIYYFLFKIFCLVEGDQTRLKNLGQARITSSCSKSFPNCPINLNKPELWLAIKTWNTDCRETIFWCHTSAGSALTVQQFVSYLTYRRCLFLGCVQ